MASSWTPRPGNGLPSREPCSACGKVGDKWMKRGWCAACYQRWDNNGRPEDGPVRIYRPRGSSTGTCPVCGEDGGWINTRGWCMGCHERWKRAGQPTSGPPVKRAGPGAPPAPVGQCPICDRTGPLRVREGWCRACHQRWYVAGKPGDQPAPAVQRETLSRSARRARNLEKLTRLRVMYALARPGEPNPYECPAPGCHETGDPARQYQCAMHDARIRHSGTYNGHECLQCGEAFKARGGWRALCDNCRESWGYCGDTLHEGERLLPREDFARAKRVQCKSCANRRSQQKRRDRGLHGTAAGLAGHYRTDSKPCPRCLQFLRSA